MKAALHHYPTWRRALFVSATWRNTPEPQDLHLRTAVGARRAQDCGHWAQNCGFTYRPDSLLGRQSRDKLEFRQAYILRRAGVSARVAHIRLRIRRTHHEGPNERPYSLQQYPYPQRGERRADASADNRPCGDPQQVLRNDDEGPVCDPL